MKKLKIISMPVILISYLTLIANAYAEPLPTSFMPKEECQTLREKMSLKCKLIKAIDTLTEKQSAAVGKR